MPAPPADRDPPVRSLHVLGSRTFGGAERFCIRLVEALFEAGHPTTVALRRESPVNDVLSAAVPRLHLPFASKWDLYTAWRLRRHILSGPPQIVQTYTGRGSRLTRVPDDGPSVQVARFGGYYRIEGDHRHAHAWVGNTPDLCDYLKRGGLPAERVFMIGNFVPPARAVADDELAAWRARLALPEDTFVLLSVGRLIDRKGFHDLLPAFASLPASISGCTPVLVIAGNGPMEGVLRTQSTALGLDGRVRWAGWQDDPTPLYRLADLFVCPSREEPLGNVILEAWSNRRAVLTTATVGAHTLAHDGVDAVFVPPQDPSAMTAALLAWIAAPAAERERLAQAGFDTVQRRHVPQAVVAAYVALFRRLLREGPRPARPGAGSAPAPGR